jgi:hypothetical protein
MGLTSRRSRRHLDRVPTRAASSDEIASTPGPGGDLKALRATVGFAITSAAERIGVGSARTYFREPPIL